MRSLDFLQENSGITRTINDLKWSFLDPDTHNYYNIIKILGELYIPTLSPRSKKQIIHILTIYKEHLIRAILLKMRGDPSIIMSQIYLNEAVPKMIRLGLDWSELKIIQKSLNAEKKRKLKEDTLNNFNYGGWIDSKNKRIHYCKEYKHNSLAKELGAIDENPMRWMFDHGFVRFVTEATPSASLSLQGLLPDIKSTFKIWWPVARRCETLYVDIVDTFQSLEFNLREDPDHMRRAQKIFGSD